MSDPIGCTTAKTPPRSAAAAEAKSSEASHFYQFDRDYASYLYQFLIGGLLAFTNPLTHGKRGCPCGSDWIEAGPRRDWNEPLINELPLK